LLVLDCLRVVGVRLLSKHALLVRFDLFLGFLLRQEQSDEANGVAA
jgi:hypothetical protein